MSRGSILFTLLTIFFWSGVLKGQPFGNEWIASNQSYLKLLTAQEGIYRVTFEDLSNAGAPVNTVLPNRYQLFHRGKEQSILVSSDPSTPLQPGDFIEFYGLRNDGTLDQFLYRTPEAQPHGFYNLYSDTTAFFLTWNISGIGGKRMNNINLFNVDNLPPESFHLEAKLLLFSDDYSQGRIYPQGAPNAETILSQFDFGEGWTGNRISLGQTSDIVLDDVDQVFAGGPLPNLEILLAGRNNRPHKVEVLAGPSESSLRSLGTTEFEFYNNQLIIHQLDFSDIGTDGTLVVRISVLGTPGINADVVSVSYVRLVYPQVLDMEDAVSKTFTLAENIQSTSFLSVQNVPANTEIFDITDPDNPAKIGFTIENDEANVTVPGTSVSRKLLFTAGASLSPAIEDVSFRNLDPATFDFLIVSNKELMQPAGETDDPVTEYADYRRSAAGGGFDVLVIEVEELFNTFSYGEKTPLALRNFVRFMASGGLPDYLFIIGKSLTVNHKFYRNGPVNGIKDLVPTGGFPGSDIALTAGLEGNDYVPSIPVGRIIAQTPEDVVAYMEKVKEIESAPFDGLWRKRLLHLSGGLTAAEIVRFRGYVNEYENIAEADFLGGEVITVTKEGNSNRELIDVADVVNEGISLITFYGHSAPNLTDIEIGDVDDPLLGYDNKGRYNTILVNGCNAGNIFTTVSSFGENWILTPDLGSVSYLAHSAVGFETPLRVWSDLFYSTAFGDSVFIAKGVGDIQKETSIKFLNQRSDAEVNITQVQQVVLQGDPAVKLFGAEKPDFQISEPQLFIDPFDEGKVTTQTDSFRIGIVVKNLGITIKDSLAVSVRRIFVDNTSEEFSPQFFDGVKFQDTLFFKIVVDNDQGFGINRFEVNLDPGNSVEELNETNNRAILDFFIPSTGTINLQPTDFGIANAMPVELIAQSSDLLDSERDFVFELDTIKSFNSPVKKSAVISAEVLARWNTLLSGSENDSLVYYWRTRFATPRTNEDTSWTMSSFTYIENGPNAGWSQSHFQQFDADELNGLIREPITGKWKFEENFLNLDLTTHGSDHPMSDPANVNLLLNEQQFIITDKSNRICRDNTINAIAFDKSSTIPYAVISPAGVFDVLDAQRCGKVPQVINNFTNGEIESSSDYLNQYIDLVPEGDFVLIFTIGEVNFENWSTGLIQKFAELGVSSGTFENLSNGEPLIILGQKGAVPGSATEITGLSSEQINLEDQIEGRFTSGTVITPKIGPAKDWLSLDKNLSDIDNADQWSCDIVGIDVLGNEVEVMPAIISTQTDLEISAETYPFLRLKFNASDTVNLDPPQLNRWTVVYEGVPEGVLLRPDRESNNADSLQKQEGEAFTTDFLFENISSFGFEDSIRVDYSLFNRDQLEFASGQIFIKPLKGEESERFSIPIETLGFAGANDLNVNANPRLQLENTFVNNVFNNPGFLNVVRDQTHPVLEVTFDGRYILDGEIVSPSPLINVLVRDENKLIPKQDTAGVDIFLKRPCETCTFEKVNFSSPDIVWFPASENADFKVEYHPKNLEDGIYTLRAQATDASGNVSGLEPYTIRFEVINESTITHFYPFPNPFSTSTRFIFTLTGAELPEQIKIQIMTISGKVVREITSEELGPLHIGNNITQFAWDGRDEYGDQLANGVYLYKVTVVKGGQIIKHRETAADKAFKKGFGKMYLLR